MLTRILIAIALAAAGAFPGAASGVAPGEVILEILAAGAGEYIVLSAAVAVGMLSISWGGGDEDYPAGIAAMYVLIGSYPLAATCGAYLVGENGDAPSENKGAAFGVTVLSAYGQTVALGGAAALVDAAYGEIDEGAYTAPFIIDIFTKPFLVTYAYNKVKKPAPARDETRLYVEPYASMTAGKRAEVVPVYGVTLSF